VCRRWWQQRDGDGRKTRMRHEQRQRVRVRGPSAHPPTRVAPTRTCMPRARCASSWPWCSQRPSSMHSSQPCSRHSSPGSWPRTSCHAPAAAAAAAHETTASVARQEPAAGTCGDFVSLHTTTAGPDHTGLAGFRPGTGSAMGWVCVFRRRLIVPTAPVTRHHHCSCPLNATICTVFGALITQARVGVRYAPPRASAACDWRKLVCCVRVVVRAPAVTPHTLDTEIPRAWPSVRAWHPR
jgi:hypothetical protein